MSAVPEYVIGQELVSTANFFNDADAPTNPVTTTFMVREPDGTETSYVYGVDANVTRPSTGVFKGTFQVTAQGLYTTRWKGTGAGIKPACEDSVRGKQSMFSTP